MPVREQIAFGKSAPGVEYASRPRRRADWRFTQGHSWTVAQASNWFDFDRSMRGKTRPGPSGVLRSGGVWIHRTKAEEEGDRIALDVYSKNMRRTVLAAEKACSRGRLSHHPLTYAENHNAPFQMETDWSLEQLLGYLSTWSATNRYIKAMGRKSARGRYPPTLRRVWGRSNIAPAKSCGITGAAQIINIGGSEFWARS